MRALSPIVLIGYLSACVTWHAQSAPPGDVIAQQPARILVTRDSGDSTTLERPTMRSDSLIGWEPDSKRSVGMPMSQVKAIGLPKHDPVKTWALVLGVGVATTYVALAIAWLAASPWVIVE